MDLRLLGMVIWFCVWVVGGDKVLDEVINNKEVKSLMKTKFKRRREMSVYKLWM